MKLLTIIAIALSAALLLTPDGPFDSDGHGPDPGTSEYSRAVELVASRRQSRLLIVAAIAAVPIAIVCGRYVLNATRKRA